MTRYRHRPTRALTAWATADAAVFAAGVLGLLAQRVAPHAQPVDPAPPAPPSVAQTDSSAPVIATAVTTSMTTATRPAATTVNRAVPRRGGTLSASRTALRTPGGSLGDLTTPPKVAQSPTEAGITTPGPTTTPTTTADPTTELPLPTDLPLPTTEETLP